MQVVAEGTFWDARTAPINERNAAATQAALLSDGTVLASCRLGSDREGADGHTAVFATTDGGDTWEQRFLGVADRVWDDWPGETRGWYMAELTPGEVLASVLWTDRSDPSRPWINPHTQGLLGMRVYHLRSTDGGRSWPDRRRIDLAPHHGASNTGPVLRLSDGALAQPFETWKEYDDPSAGVPAAWLRLSSDEGVTWREDVLVARHPDNALFYWDQRLATHPVDGRLVNMFWTHAVGRGADVDVHIAWGSPDGRTWTTPTGTGLAGQHCQPIALGDDRLLAVYSHREDPPGIHAALSEDFGRTWDLDADLEVWASPAGGEPGAGGPRGQDEFWSDMGAWQFGHPRGVLLPSGEVLVVFYGGTGVTRSARWVRIRP